MFLYVCCVQIDAVDFFIQPDNVIVVSYSAGGASDEWTLYLEGNGEIQTNWTFTGNTISYLTSNMGSIYESYSGGFASMRSVGVQRVVNNYITKFKEWNKLVKPNTDFIGGIGDTVVIETWDHGVNEAVLKNMIVDGHKFLTLPLSLKNPKMGIGKTHSNRTIQVADGSGVEFYDAPSSDFGVRISNSLECLDMHLAMTTRIVSIPKTVPEGADPETLDLTIIDKVGFLRAEIGFLKINGLLSPALSGDETTDTGVAIESYYGSFMRDVFAQYNSYLYDHRISHSDINFDSFLDGSTPYGILDNSCVEPECEGADASGAPDLSVSNLKTGNKSTINNHTLEYIHTAYDFRLPSGTPGCASCGAASSPSDGLPALDIRLRCG
ncbi:MAG: hypothetical protein HRU15_15095 [Planctomycetes bacterium]|nr:hypothetical protein [Planctomycetota bacterium]